MDRTTKNILIYIVIGFVVYVAIYYLWWKKRDGMPCDYSAVATGSVSNWKGKYLGYKCIPASAYDTQMGLLRKNNL